MAKYKYAKTRSALLARVSSPLWATQRLAASRTSSCVCAAACGVYTSLGSGTSEEEGAEEEEEEAGRYASNSSKVHDFETFKSGKSSNTFLS
jgi:hypothetical protein